MKPQLRALAFCAAIALPVFLAQCGGGGGGGGSTPPPSQSPSSSSRWPMLGQNLSSTFNNTAETVLTASNTPSLHRVWRLVPRGSVLGAVAVVDGTVYALATGALYALNARTGAVIWQKNDITGTSSPTYSDGTLFVHDGQSFLHAVDPATGNIRWRTKTDDHGFAAGYSSPVITGRFVIVGISSSEETTVSQGATFRGGVAAYDRTTGQQIWRFFSVDPPLNGVGVWSSVSIDEAARTVFATTGNSYTGTQAGQYSDSILALELDTGRLRWARQMTEGDIFTIPNPQGPDADFGTNPILFEATINGTRRRLLGAGQKSGRFYVLDRDNGTVVWERQVSGGSELVGGFLNNGAYDGQRIIVAGNLGSSGGGGSEPSDGSSGPGFTSVLMAMDGATGNVLWERQVAAFVWAPITIANGVGWVAVNKQMQAFRTDNGQRLFTYDTNGTIPSAPVVAEGRVYFGSGLAYYSAIPDEDFHVLGLDAPVATPTPGTSPTPGGGTTFTAIYNDIIVQRLCTACHGTQGNLQMNTRDQAYASLVNVRASGEACASSGLMRVQPGNPDASLLVDKVSRSRPACGDSMPPGQVLAAADIERIRAWILAGARND